MSARKTIGTLSILGGLGLGAALVYLLDPDKGPTRRARWRQTAVAGLSSTGQVLGSAVGALGSQASSLTGRAASALGSQASNLTGRAVDMASDYIHRGRQSLPNVTDYIPSMAEEEDEDTSTTTTVLTAVGCCCAGAALMFFLDPSQGRNRRRYVADKTTSAVRQSTETVRKKARHAGNVAKGMYHQAKTRFSSDETETAPRSFNPDM